MEERLSVGTPVLLEIDLEGARQVREAMPEATLVSWPHRPGRCSPDD